MTLQLEQTTESALSESPYVLVVDDNQAVTRALTVVLSRAGYRVSAHQQGLAALDFVAAHRRIIAAVVDVHLPDVSGLTLAGTLRERLGPVIPIVVVSGDTSMENLNALSQVGATYFFSKPLQPRLLVARLRQWLV